MVHQHRPCRLLLLLLKVHHYSGETTASIHNGSSAPPLPSPPPPPESTSLFWRDYSLLVLTMRYQHLPGHVVLVQIHHHRGESTAQTHRIGYKTPPASPLTCPPPTSTTSLLCYRGQEKVHLVLTETHRTAHMMTPLYHLPCLPAASTSTPFTTALQMTGSIGTLSHRIAHIAVPVPPLHCPSPESTPPHVTTVLQVTAGKSTADYIWPSESLVCP